ncbi:MULTISPECIES: SDR family NAD(P)-dependent oxidoreductase [Sphingobium]|uniref:SDR family NAD(P)-dependent oxidoreductase n=1 Tax=Sphingobium TaxID=165695 RepID=UPI00159CB37F|nr:glucose 1-dehydrogenase [Sphingobium sp. 15-1]
MRGLSEKVAVITGAASPVGIGFAAASRLAEEGARVVLTDINAAAVADRAEALRHAGYQAIGLGHDATRETEWDEVLRATKAQFGQLDIVVNNAAICITSHLIDMSLADWRRQLDVNGSMTFLGCRMAAREMQAAGRGGAIVNVASIAAIVAGEYGGAYCASKGAVQMLTKVLAIENAKFGIRVNSVNPGYTETQMFTDSAEDPAASIAQMAAVVPAGRLGQPTEMAAAIAFLASDDAAYCNGCAIVVDGGMTAQ